MREKILSVTLADCDVQTMRAGGPGGQKQNKTESAVRIVHRASGARGECRETRSQAQNKKIAFRRMVETPTFQAWLKMQTGRDHMLRAKVEQEMYPHNIKVEVREDGQWVEQ